MPYSNIIDYLAQGMRETNPGYVARQKVLQQQQFEQQQHESDRNSLTAFEKAELDSQKQNRQDQQDTARGEAVAKGLYLQSNDPNDLVPDSAKATPTPAATPFNFATAGQAQPTPSTPPATPPSAFSMLTGQPSQTPSAPSQTASGQTGSDSGPLAAILPPKPGAVPTPTQSPTPTNYAAYGIKQHPDGSYGRWATPDEIATNKATTEATLTQQQKEAGRANIASFAADPKNADILKRSPHLLDAAVTRNELGGAFSVEDLKSQDGDIVAEMHKAMDDNDMPRYLRLKQFLMDTQGKGNPTNITNPYESFYRGQKAKNPNMADDDIANAWLKSEAANKRAGEPEPGSWSLQQDPTTGKTVIFNNKTTEVRPIAGVEKADSGAIKSREFQGQVIGKAGDDLINAINQHRDKLGTVGALWNQAKNGTPIADPDTSGLMSQIASFAALQPSLHGFRGQQALAGFEKMIGGVPKNPDALIASIRAIQQTARTVASGGRVNNPDDDPAGLFK